MPPAAKTTAKSSAPGGASGRSRSGKSAAPKPPKLSRTRAPEHLSPEDWQRVLRRQYGREQVFGLENLGSELVFSEFRVGNPAAGTAYRVAIRGRRPGENYCSCPDFATNELGTCKHIEFTLGALERRRGTQAALRRGYRPPFSELYLRYGGARGVHFRSGSECPPQVLAAARALFDEAQDWRLPPQRFGLLQGFTTAVAKTGHELRCYDDALVFVAGVRDAQSREHALAKEFPQGAADPGLAKLLKVPLYPYQAEGALFAVQAGRCLIGDEMGLGKTIQAIAAAEILARLCGVTRVLVVCPTSLKYQWQREIARFSGRQARVIGGLRAVRQKEYAEEDFCKITNYEKLKADLDLIAHWGPELVIVDEAQRVKNWNTIAARALKRIDSPYAVVLTGTPLENKLEELISIVQFVDQHRLGPTWKLLHTHQMRDDHGRVVGYRELEKIGETLAPVLIRRRKAEVLTQLPSRTDQTLLVPMTAAQMGHHVENGDIVARIAKRWRKTGYLSEKDQRMLTCALQNMRMSCNSTWLLDKESDHGVKADELAALFDELFAQPDAKAVVFSQWLGTHEILVRRFKARGWGHVLFHGGVPSEQRPALVDRFRDDPHCRVFLSTDAGSTGLNLQHASTLINMDLPWNPAILEQRIARIHRLGQKRPVQIVNFVSQGTIEEGMLSVLAFKRSLSAGILDGGEGEISLGGSRLSRFMKDVEKVTGAMGEADAVEPAEEMGAREEAAEPQEVPDVCANGAAEAPVAAAGTARSAVTAGAAEGDGAADEIPPAGATDAGEAAPVGPAAGASSPPAAAPAGADPWAALLGIGAQFAEALKAAAAPPGAGAGAHPWVVRDEATGGNSLKIPLPEPETVRLLADTLSQLAQALRGR
ncbi:MAG: DEAD/DEAH box helicase [Betaproteobacteria bacterium]|nr:DEAD/DEAH box helicase [Betaproteobacteria bacterium]